MRRPTALTILATALAIAIFAGQPVVAFFLADAVILVLMIGPTKEQRDARRRNRHF